MFVSVPFLLLPYSKVVNGAIVFRLISFVLASKQLFQELFSAGIYVLYRPDFQQFLIRVVFIRLLCPIFGEAADRGGRPRGALNF